jgi:hypothetical protein
VNGAADTAKRQPQFLLLEVTKQNTDTAQPILGDRESLDLFQPWLGKSFASVIIPFHQGVVFIRSLNRAEFSGEFSEVTTAFNTISGKQFLAIGRWFDERRPAGTV